MPFRPVTKEIIQQAIEEHGWNIIRLKKTGEKNGKFDPNGSAFIKFAKEIKTDPSWPFVKYEGTIDDMLKTVKRANCVVEGSVDKSGKFDFKYFRIFKAKPSK